MLYLFYPLVQDIINEDVLVHLLNYIVFMRLLCSDKVSKDDITDSMILIKEFSKNHEFFFGKNDMTYNLHMHLHLPRQVLLIGPLNRISCFPFENMFKITRTMFHGVHNFDGQIAKHLEIRKINRNELKNLMISNSDDSNTNSFIKNSFSPNSYTSDGL